MASIVMSAGLTVKGFAAVGGPAARSKAAGSFAGVPEWKGASARWAGDGRRAIKGRRVLVGGNAGMERRRSLAVRAADEDKEEAPPPASQTRKRVSRALS